MKIYLLRHGDAAAAQTDDERPLSSQGINEIERLAKFLLPLKIQVTKTLQSTKLRAQQTAKIVLTAIHSQQPPETRNELSPSHSTETIFDELIRSNQDCLVVGHLPFLEKLLGKLVFRNEYEPIIAFKTGTLVCLEKIGTDKCVICWMINGDALPV